MKFLKRTGQVILIPLIVGLIVFVLLAVSYLLPTGRMKDYLRMSIDVFENEGVYFQITSEMGELHDNFTEAVYLSQAVVGTQEASLPDLVVNNYGFVENGKGAAYPIDGITSAVYDLKKETISLDNSFYRFFSGWLIVLKPLLMVMGYPDVRLVCAYTCLLGTALLGWLMYRKKYGKYIVPVMISVFFLRPLAVFLSMAFASIYLCALIPCIAMLLIRKETLRERGWLLFGITGAATFCFNMNFFQLICFGMPLAFYFLITGVPEKPVGLLKSIADLFAAWMAGYAGTMLLKWGVYSIVTGNNIFEAMFNHALWRSGLEEGSRLEAVASNLGKNFGSIWLDLLEVGFIGWTIFRWRKNRTKLSVSAAEILLLVLMLLLPAGRVAILANHSIRHSYFVYRVFMIPVLALNFLLAKKFLAQRREGIE